MESRWPKNANRRSETINLPEENIEGYFYGIELANNLNKTQKRINHRVKNGMDWIHKNGEFLLKRDTIEKSLER